MESIPSTNRPESTRTCTTNPKEWSGIAVRLLQGVLYQDDNPSVWEILLNSLGDLSNYFETIGLSLIVDEVNAMAYLRQNEDPNDSKLETTIPRLFRRQPLSYDQTLLCVLLREEVRQFEETDVQNDRCIVQQGDLLSVWQAFFPENHDAVKLNRTLSSALRKLEDLKFVRQFEKDPPSWEICRILKARLPLDALEALKQNLMEEVAKRHSRESMDRPASTSLNHEE
ncbi:MAG: DUF4194 domain-containing protein [Planctomycetes bacterium]|nr:DUF4194 domain-containing protein [Planctomycetota bacterium]